MVKLDRVLCTSEWEDLFPDCILQSLVSEVSDHCPLLLGLREGVHGKKRFHFESYWTKLEGFHDTVAASSNEPIAAACPLERISLKLKRLTRALQSWSQRQVGHISSQHAIAREILHRLEIARDGRELSVEEKWLLGELKRYCLVLASLQRTIARLRSRIRVLKEGDANTSFFHQQVGFRKRRNFIPKLVDGDQVVTSQEGNQQIMLEYYENLLCTALPRANTLNLAFFHRQGVNLDCLDALITEDEVWEAIKSMRQIGRRDPTAIPAIFTKHVGSSSSTTLWQLSLCSTKVMLASYGFSIQLISR